MASYLTHLECSACGVSHEAEEIQTICHVCGKVLFPRYDLAAVRNSVSRDHFVDRETTLWRYRELLPIRDDANIVSLGEGWTPLLPARRLANRLGCRRLWLKDEGVNPTGSFKARGVSVAVSRARELGCQSLATPSAGNAAVAMSAYAARAGLRATVFMPEDAPAINQELAVTYGATLCLVRGLITDCGRVVRREAAKRGWFDLSTLREPYRAEGKKTMGYEIAEQLGWRLPDVIIYPTGGGTGIVGMWKAFEEMEQLGWIGPKRPRIICVQADGCAPIVRAFNAGLEHADPWVDAHTFAAGLRVPSAIGDYLILRALRESHGDAIAVSDDDISRAVEELAQTEGIFASTEAAATVAGLRRLVQAGRIDRDEETVLFLTGSGLLNPSLGAVKAPVVDPDDIDACDRAFHRQQL